MNHLWRYLGTAQPRIWKWEREANNASTLLEHRSRQYRKMWHVCLSSVCFMRQFPIFKFLPGKLLQCKRLCSWGYCCIECRPWRGLEVLHSFLVGILICKDLKSEVIWWNTFSFQLKQHFILTWSTCTKCRKRFITASRFSLIYSAFFDRPLW